MITKLTASLLFAHSYKLVDKEGNEWDVDGIEGVVDATIIKLKVGQASTWINIKSIGSDFFVLCRPYEQLTKEVNGVVPARWLWSVDVHEEDEFDLYGVVPKYWKTNIKLIKEQPSSMSAFEWEKLHEIHFKPSSLPDECCRFIEG